MRTRRYLPSKMLLLLMAVAMLGGCTEEELGGGKSLPEGKYPLEFTTQMYGMEVTRATSGNTWDGGEQIAIRVGSDTRKYTVSDKNTGKITSAAGVVPFYWTSTTETKTVSAYYPFALAEASTITVKEEQNIVENYQVSDALYAAATSIAFNDATKKLTFKHLSAKVVANLKAGDGVTNIEVQGATVKFVGQSLTTPFNNSTGVVTAASPGSSSVASNVLASPASGFAKSVQALLVPCQMKSKQFIEVTIGSDKFYYTPTSDTDGKLESGKVSTYEITVKRDGIEVKLTESNAWGDGGNQDVQSSNLNMQFTIDLTSYPSDMTYILPFRDSGNTGNYTLTVDWGDGSEATTISSGYPLSSPEFSHSYAEAKEYKITITSTQTDFAKEQIPGFKPGNYRSDNNNSLKLKSLLTPLLNTGETNFSYCFYNCTKLTGSIPENLFINNPLVTEFSYCFSDCSSLTSIPKDLFYNNPQVTNFTRCFYSCSSLTSIPKELFANNPLVVNFTSCFQYCSNLTGEIPAELFANNPLVTKFTQCFHSCSNLTSIPKELFANNSQVKDFSYCFSSCSKLTGEIPAGLFANNSQVKDFSYCFQGCSNLTCSIPAGLFANNPQVTNFSSCFQSCSNLTGEIPAGLFANNPLVTNFKNCFSSCSKLTGEIPAGLFANNSQVKDFSSCFQGCSNLIGSIPAGLFANNSQVTAFSFCFSSCSNLIGSIPAGLFANNSQVTAFSSCFNGCTNLTSSIPEGLFANNLLVINFSSCFANCTKLKMTSNIFCDEAADKTTRFAGKTVNFSACFYQVGSDALVKADAGTAPALWNYAGTFTKTQCFRYIGTVTNATAIPTEWK